MMSGIFRRRHLPHWDVADATYFVTTCLAGSIPAAGFRELEDYRRQLESRPRPTTVPEADWEHLNRKLRFAKLDELLDDRPAVRHFDNPEVAALVENSIRHFADTRYRLLAFVIMPSHLHWVFHPMSEWCETLPPGRTPREVVMHGLKSYTATQCNRVLGRTGPFWQDESYDHWVRDEDELVRIVEYVENNPVKAGLVANPAEFVFSSAHHRARNPP
jgi:REP element-mobilizing transposase RayT